MRLAPIPIFYSSCAVEEATAFARLQSETTHPGDLASRAAEFLAFCIHRAINFRRSPLGSFDILISSGEFLDIVVEEYLKTFCSNVGVFSAEPFLAGGFLKYVCSINP